MKTTRIFNDNNVSYKDVLFQTIESELDKIVDKTYNGAIEDTASKERTGILCRARHV